MVYSTCIYLYVLVFDSKELEYDQGMLGVLGALKQIAVLKIIWIYIYLSYKIFWLWGFVWICDFQVFSGCFVF